jgi:hypothetical protein
MVVSPYSAHRRFHLVLQRIQAAVDDVSVEHLRHTGANLLGIHIATVALDTRDVSAAAIPRLRFHDGLLLEAHLGQMLMGAVAEGLALLGRVDLAEANS